MDRETQTAVNNNNRMMPLQEQLHFYAASGDLGSCYSLIRTVDVNALNSGNRAGCVSLIRTVDVNALNSNGKSPLMLAAINSHPHIVVFLMDAGADINCLDEQKCTVLHHASKRGWKEIVRTLVDDYKMDPDVKNSFGETPLMLAARWGFPKIVGLLIQRGANVNIYDDSNMSVLHHASIKGCLKTFETILKKDIDNINARDESGNTPLHLVLAHFREIRIVYLLMEHGADINLKDSEGILPFSQLVLKQISKFKKFGYSIKPPVFVGAIRVCIMKGAFVTDTDYSLMLEEPLLKSNILQRGKLCSQAIINRFNNDYLPDLYKVLNATNILPPINKLKIREGSEAVPQIERSVELEIKNKKVCNVIETKTLVLKIMCVKSILVYAKSNELLRLTNRESKPSCSQSGLKRSVSTGNPSKKKCVDTSNTPGI